MTGTSTARGRGRRRRRLLLVALVVVVAVAVVVTLLRSGGDAPGPKPPAAADDTPAFATGEQIASLATKGSPADRVKAIADGVRDGRYEGGDQDSSVTDIKDIDNRVGAIALTTALWWRRTGDDSYLEPLRKFILASPRRLQPGVTGLAEMRAYGGLFAAVDLLQRADAWDAEATLPNFGDVTWDQFMNGGGELDKPLPERALSDSGRNQWRTVRGTAVDAANNWGAVARFAYLMWAVCEDDQEAMDQSVALLKKWLGEDPDGVADFRTTTDFDASWSNWGNEDSGADHPLEAGVGRRDAAQPGLDGVVIEDVARGGGTFDPDAKDFGAQGQGLTYPLETAGAVLASVGVLQNFGYDPRSWGQNGDALDRMNRWLDSTGTSGPDAGDGEQESVLSEAEDQFDVYRNFRWYAGRLASRTEDDPRPTRPGPSGLDRLTTYGDWLAAPGSGWGR